MNDSSRLSAHSARRLIARAAALSAIVALSVTVAAPRVQAMRHLKLLRSSPVADTALASSPDAIRLWMSEPVNAPISKIALATDAGAVITLGRLTRGAAKDAPLVASIVAPLAHGRYKVTWKAMSKDGHVVNGSFAFRVGAAH
ncbi:MAG: copper resistance CopC family protein [Gemmatimonas sp.]